MYVFFLCILDVKTSWSSKLLKKKKFLVYVGGLGAKLSFSSKIKDVDEYCYRGGKTVGRLAFYTWVG